MSGNVIKKFSRQSSSRPSSACNQTSSIPISDCQNFHTLQCLGENSHEKSSRPSSKKMKNAPAVNIMVDKRKSCNHSGNVTVDRNVLGRESYLELLSKPRQRERLQKTARTKQKIVSCLSNTNTAGISKPDLNMLLASINDEKFSLSLMRSELSIKRKHRGKKIYRRGSCIQLADGKIDCWKSKCDNIKCLEVLLNFMRFIISTRCPPEDKIRTVSGEPSKMGRRSKAVKHNLSEELSSTAVSLKSVPKTDLEEEVIELPVRIVSSESDQTEDGPIVIKDYVVDNDKHVETLGNKFSPKNETEKFLESFIEAPEEQRFTIVERPSFTVSLQRSITVSFREVPSNAIIDELNTDTNAKRHETQQTQKDDSGFGTLNDDQILAQLSQSEIFEQHSQNDFENMEARQSSTPVKSVSGGRSTIKMDDLGDLDNVDFSNSDINGDDLFGTALKSSELSRLFVADGEQNLPIESPSAQERIIFTGNMFDDAQPDDSILPETSFEMPKSPVLKLQMFNSSVQADPVQAKNGNSLEAPHSPVLQLQMFNDSEQADPIAETSRRSLEATEYQVLQLQRLLDLEQADPIEQKNGSKLEVAPDVSTSEAILDPSTGLRSFIAAESASSSPVDQTTFFTPMVALRKFTEADENYDRNIEVLLRVQESEMVRVYVARRLNNESDVRKFCRNEASNRSKIFEVEATQQSNVIVNRLPITDFKTICGKQHQSSLIETSARFYQPPRQEMFSVQRIDDVKEISLVDNDYMAVDIEVREDYFNDAKFNVTKLPPPSQKK